MEGEFGVRHFRNRIFFLFPHSDPNGIYSALALGSKITITKKLKIDARWLLGFPSHKEDYYTIDFGRVSPRTPLYSDRVEVLKLVYLITFFNP